MTARIVTCAVFAAVFAAGCGGGDGGPTALGEAALPARAPALTAGDETAEQRAGRLLDFGEAAYPALLSGGGSLARSVPFTYRFYADSGVYAGVVSTPDAAYNYEDVYVLGGPFGNSPVRVGNMRDYLPESSAQGFVKRSGTKFTLNGHPFPVVGANAAQSIANNDRSAMRSSLRMARQMGATVVRIFGASEIGSLDGTKPTLGTSPSFRPYFQYWDVTAQAPAFNEGANGLQLLDDVIWTARENGLRVIVALADNWDDFYGGINQYVTWYGGSRHGDFFTDSGMKSAYRNWVSHLLNRTNTKTGLRYADDPTIMAWELANEASCYGGQSWPADGCDRSHIETWIAEMAAHVRSLAPHQLIAVGDQGHFGTRDDPAMGWPYRSTNEPDLATVLAIQNIDFGTYHVYPYDFPEGDGSLTPAQYARRYVADRQVLADQVGKPMLLEETGARNAAFHAELFDTVFGELAARGAPGFLFWGIAGRFDNGQLIWDSQGYTIEPGTSSATEIATWISSFISALRD